MPNRILRTLMLALLAVVLGTASTQTTARAQTAACLTGVSADDCQLLADALSTTTSTLNSANLTYNATLKAAGVPNPAMPTVDFSGQGQASVDLSQFMLALTADYSLNNQTFKNEIRIVGDEGYYNSTQATGGKWFKSAVKWTPEQKAMLKLSSLNTLLASPNVSQIVSVATTIPGFITTTVTDGTSASGEASRIFTFDVSADAFFKSETGQQVIVTYLKTLAKTANSLNPSAPTPGPDEAYKQQVNAMLLILGPVIQATKFQVVLEIGTESKFPQSLTVTFSTKASANLVSTMTRTTTTTDLTVDMKANIALSKFNEAVTVEPVADAVEQK